MAIPLGFGKSKAWSFLPPRLTMNFWNAFLVMVSVCLSTTLAAFTESMRSVESTVMRAEIEGCKENMASTEVGYVWGFCIELY